MHGNNSNNYTHLSQEERIEIYSYLRKGLSIRKIAVKLKHSHTTISREIRRNGKDIGYDRIKYNPLEAQKLYNNRIHKRNYRHRILVKDQRKRKWICSQLKMGDVKIGVDEILGRYKLETGERICATSTVYNWIRNKRGEWECLLRYKGFGYHKRGDRRKIGKYRDIETIDKRPSKINSREEVYDEFLINLINKKLKSSGISSR